jgi:hypothetical protein
MREDSVPHESGLKADDSLKNQGKNGQIGKQYESRHISCRLTVEKQLNQETGDEPSLGF